MDWSSRTGFTPLNITNGVGGSAALIQSNTAPRTMPHPAAAGSGIFAITLISNWNP